MPPPVSPLPDGGESYHIVTQDAAACHQTPQGRHASGWKRGPGRRIEDPFPFRYREMQEQDDP